VMVVVFAWCNLCCAGELMKSATLSLCHGLHSACDFVSGVAMP